MIVKIIINLENKMEKIQEWTNKDGEEVKTKHRDKKQNYLNLKYSIRNQEQNI